MNFKEYLNEGKAPTPNVNDVMTSLAKLKTSEQYYKFEKEFDKKYGPGVWKLEADKNGLTYETLFARFLHKFKA